MGDLDKTMNEKEEEKEVEEILQLCDECKTIAEILEKYKGAWERLAKL